MGMMLTYRPGYWGDAPAAPDEADVVAKPLSKRNLVELQATARGYGLSEDGSKAELRDRIREHEAAGVPTAKPGDGQPGVDDLDDQDETPDGEQPEPENDPADTEDDGDESQPDPENAPEDAPETTESEDAPESE